MPTFVFQVSVEDWQKLDDCKTDGSREQKT